LRRDPANSTGKPSRAYFRWKQAQAEQVARSDRRQTGRDRIGNCLWDRETGDLALPPDVAVPINKLTPAANAEPCLRCANWP
jgi:hypothetical protein